MAIPVVSELTPSRRRDPRPGPAAAAVPCVVADREGGSGLSVRSRDSAGRTDAIMAQSDDNDDG